MSKIFINMKTLNYFFNEMPQWKVNMILILFFSLAIVMSIVIN